MAAIADERQRAAAEVLEDRPKGFQPLNVEYHVVGAQCEAVAVNVEEFPVDRHRHGVATPRTGELVVIGNRHTEAPDA
jgi:hypothetical protein